MARGFLVGQMACQLALLSPYLGAARVLIRAIAFLSSIALVLLVRRGRGHPAERFAFVAAAIVVLELFHPTTNSFLSGTAQVALHLAVLAPLYWASRLELRTRDVRQLVFILWMFHFASASVGILQALFPGRFQPNVSTVIQNQGSAYLEGLQITLANGERIFRPMGLTDVPGGAANAGFYTVLFGLAFLLTAERWIWKAVATSALVIGMTAIYLCQVRAILLRLAICLVAYVVLLAARGRIKRFGLVAVATVGILVGSYVVAYAVGGKAVTARYESLLTEDPGHLYYKNRGQFLEATFNELLPEYPLGAGLGRYGMMYSYFGDDRDPRAGQLHVEIQFTAWILDGGLPLMLAYLLAVSVAMTEAWQTSRSPDEELQLWGGMLLAYDVGALALCFSYAVFAGQVGIEFWFLNGIVFAATRRYRRALVAMRARMSVHG